jgi:hypothetical protein
MVYLELRELGGIVDASERDIFANETEALGHDDQFLPG